ncbi:hypothetical protein N0V90_002958 [Kalmusia sp. IMI 367209]|nr:hypothetical protein N0V90_002958 [Kalmusia sp. IMI 367209]
MKLNEHLALFTPKILLVPYCPHHVPTYHSWMQDPALQAATASEPLTLEKEYAMQTSWRTDADKLTFIVCKPPPSASSNLEHVTAEKEDAPQNMIGDVNLFLNPDDEDDEDEEGADGLQVLIGEIEIMIAEKAQQGKGLGREILLTFIWYILHSYAAIMNEYHSSNANGKKGSYMKYLRVKIDKENLRSIKLFESAGFKKTSETPNYFGELELRWAISVNATKEVQARMEAVPRSVAYKS